MGVNEKRILITYCSNTCHAHRVQVDPFDEQPGTYCDQSGRYVKITDEECAKCKHPILTGITRKEALKKMQEGFLGAMHSGARTMDQALSGALDSLLGKK